MSEKQCSNSNCSANDCKNCVHNKNNAALRFENCNEIANVIGIVSGKGGVGKSTVTALLARKLADAGYRVGILDGDITGPSIPKMFGLSGNVRVTDKGMEPMVSSEGIKVISMNLLLDKEEDPVVFRGPILAQTIKQFWSEVNWGKLDYLLVDMPPGTGDVPLTVYQSLPVKGIVIVTSPQELVKMIVMKACNMADKMNIPVLGLVENYSYFQCPDCGGRHNIFGESRIEELSKNIGTKIIARIPVIPKLAETADNGMGEYDGISVDLEAITGCFG